MKFLTLVLVFSVGSLGLFETCRCTAVADIQCNADDTKYWRTGGGFFEFNKTAEEAATRAVRGGNTDFVGVAAVFFDDYSASCQDCFTNILVCVFDECLPKCVQDAFDFTGGTNSPECEECADVNCRGNFTLCSGFDVKRCSGCTKPEEEDLTILYAAIAGAVIAIISAIVAYKTYTAYKNKPSREDAAQIALKNMGILKEVTPEDLRKQENQEMVPVEVVPSFLPPVQQVYETEFPDQFETFDHLDQQNMANDPFADIPESPSLSEINPIFGQNPGSSQIVPLDNNSEDDDNADVNF